MKRCFNCAALSNATCFTKYLHLQVKQAVSKKDDSLAQMQDRLKTAIARCQHLEELLDRQQKDLFARKH